MANSMETIKKIDLNFTFFFTILLSLFYIDGLGKMGSFTKPNNTNAMNMPAKSASMKPAAPLTTVIKKATMMNIIK